MPLRAGEEVVAARTLAMGRVPKDTPGRIIKTGFFGGYDVQFNNGPILRGVSRDALTHVSGGPWWARGRKL
jgi:hypothetical protein